jgi:outer membrane protein OmpA-like peptidoglycan-associated protein
MASMLDAVRNLVTPDLITRMSAHIGDSEAMVSKGFSAAVPLLLTSLAGKADNKSFMSQLAGIAAETAGDPNALTRLPQIATGASAIDTASPTGRWLSDLFGSNIGGVIDGIARYANVGKGSSINLLSMAAPIILGYLGRLMRSDNLGPTGIADRLRSQQSAFAAAIPTGLAGLLPAFTKAPAVTHETRRVDPVVASAVVPERSSRNWAVPLILGALALGGLMMWNARDRNVPRVANVETVTIFREAPKPIGTSGTLPAAAIPAPSIDWAVFDEIEFNTGSSTLTSASREELDRIATALTAHPGAHVQIAGHTDSTGNEPANMALSRARANTVRDTLRDKGVDSDRMQAEGYGSSNPVASNETEEGRAQNRRVTVEVSGR